MHSPFVGEFMGTLILILLGDGVVANVLLKRSKAEGAGWMVITSGWCFAVLAGIFTAVGWRSDRAQIKPPHPGRLAAGTDNQSQAIPSHNPQLLGGLLAAVV